MSDDLERVLNNAESEAARDKEISRILNSNSLDYYLILEVVPEDDDALKNNTKKRFRKKSLLIHPDKTSNPHALTAFDLLKKAELVFSIQDLNLELLAEKQRLDAIYKEAMTQVGVNGEELVGTLLDKVRKKVSEILATEEKNQEIDRSYEQLQRTREDAEAKKRHEARVALKNLEVKWEDSRDRRVSNWRKYTDKVEKQKHKKKKRNFLA